MYLTALSLSTPTADNVFSDKAHTRFCLLSTVSNPFVRLRGPLTHSPRAVVALPKISGARVTAEGLKNARQKCLLIDKKRGPVVRPSFRKQCPWAFAVVLNRQTTAPDGCLKRHLCFSGTPHRPDSRSFEGLRQPVQRFRASDMHPLERYRQVCRCRRPVA